MSTHNATINVLRALCLLGEKGGRMNVSEVIESLEVSRATAYRYMSYLESFGLASRLGRGEFILGPEIPLLDKAARTGDILLTEATPVVDNLCRNSGLTVLLEKVFGQRRTVVSLQHGVAGPTRLVEIQGSTEASEAPGNCGRILETPADLKIRMVGRERDLADGCGAEVLGSGDSELVCVVGEERLEANVFDAPVFLSGRVVCRLVALLQPGAEAWSNVKHMKEQVRRAALRVEARLEAQLRAGAVDPP